MTTGGSFSRRSFAAASLVLAAGCRLNKLPKYHSRLAKAFLVVDVQQPPQVRTGDTAQRETSGIHGMVNAATNIAKEVIAVDLRRRVRDLIPPGRAMEIIAAIMVERLPEIGLEHVALEAAPDTRMELQIPAYGISATNDIAPASCFVNFTALLVYEPQGKKIWRLRRQLSLPIADVHVAISSNSVVGNISNTAALNNLEDAKLEAMLVAMVGDATHMFMDQLAVDFARAKMGRR